MQVAARSDQEIAALLLKLQRDHRGVYGALAVSPLTLVQQRASLPKDVVVVDYFAAADALYAFVVRRDDPAPRAFKIDVPRDRLTRTIARHRQLLGQDGRLADASARDLYTWLLAPLDGLVPAAQREAATVVVIAEGPLQYVPFAALVASPEGAPVVYAVERWRLATALSTTVFGLFEPALARPATQSVLAFLDPTGELAGARNELDGVADVTALRGAEATSQAFMAEAQRFPILHFATHGSIDQADPLASGLRMAGGMLSIDAITGFTGLRGHTRLVVLSACQTATEVGDVADAPEDEAISMARGFAIAGVPSVVASLWDVDDQATRALMRAFYAELASPKRDILGALRAAQIRLLRGAAGSAPAPVAIGGAAPATETERPLGDPRFWSGFQLIGDWR
ncbi:MAG: CHAT domain-containing protein [Myxococcota bacterium]